MKMAAMRAQDWADISRMLGLASDEVLNEVRAVVAHYSPEDSGDLESLIFIGQKEREQPPVADARTDLQRLRKLHIPDGSLL